MLTFKQTNSRANLLTNVDIETNRNTYKNLQFNLTKPIIQTGRKSSQKLTLKIILQNDKKGPPLNQLYSNCIVDRRKQKEREESQPFP